MFSENLKTIRKAKGYTQEELAIKVNVVRQTVSKWEKGQSSPDTVKLIQLAELFDVEVEYLATGIKPEPKSVVLNVVETRKKWWSAMSAASP